MDWTTASIGARGVDVAHARWNLALDYGPEYASAFLAAYLRTVPDYRHDMYWDAAQVADWLDETSLDAVALSRLSGYVDDILD